MKLPRVNEPPMPPVLLAPVAIDVHYWTVDTPYHVIQRWAFLLPSDAAISRVEIRTPEGVRVFVEVSENVG